MKRLFVRITFYQVVFIIMLGMLCHCGEVIVSSFDSHVPTQSPPVLQQITPTQSQPGAELTLYGLGFSFVAAENLIWIGEELLLAETYTLLDENDENFIEALTVTIPEDILVGSYEVQIQVFDLVSPEALPLEIIP